MSKKDGNFLYVSLEQFEKLEGKVDAFIEKAALHNSRTILTANLINRYNGDLLQFADSLIDHEGRLGGMDTRMDNFFGQLLAVQGDLRNIERDEINFKQIRKKLKDCQRMVAGNTSILHTYILSQNTLNNELVDRVESLEAMVKTQASEIQLLQAIKTARSGHYLMDLKFEPVIPAVPLSEKPNILRSDK